MSIVCPGMDQLFLDAGRLFALFLVGENEPQGDAASHSGRVQKYGDVPRWPRRQGRKARGVIIPVAGKRRGPQTDRDASVIECHRIYEPDHLVNPSTTDTISGLCRPMPTPWAKINPVLFVSAVRSGAVRMAETWSWSPRLMRLFSETVKRFSCVAHEKVRQSSKIRHVQHRPYNIWQPHIRFTASVRRFKSSCMKAMEWRGSVCRKQ